MTMVDVHEASKWKTNTVKEHRTRIKIGKYWKTQMWKPSHERMDLTEYTVIYNGMDELVTKLYF